MNPLDRAASENPALYAFGTGPLRRLSAEEEEAAPFEARLESIWGYLVQQATRFVEGLSERERAHLGADDLLGAVALRLLEKDRKWQPGRGRYITFAEQVLRNVCIAEREKARVVRAPSNARERLERYRRRDAEGKLGPGPRRTMRALEAALGEVQMIHAVGGGETSRSDAEREHRERAGRDVIAALRSLDNPLHALVLAGAWGLFGSPERSPAEIAEGMPGVDARMVRALRQEAEGTLRERVRKLREHTE